MRLRQSAEKCAYFTLYSFLRGISLVQSRNVGLAHITGVDDNAKTEAQRLSGADGQAAVLGFISGEIMHAKDIGGEESRRHGNANKWGSVGLAGLSKTATPTVWSPTLP